MGVSAVVVRVGVRLEVVVRPVMIHLREALKVRQVGLGILTEKRAVSVERCLPEAVAHPEIYQRLMKALSENSK